MVYQVIIGRAAEQDLISIARYVARDNPEAAERLVSKLLGEARSLETFPYRGGHFKERPGTRFTTVGNYLVVFRVLESAREVRILRFWHAARERRRTNL